VQNSSLFSHGQADFFKIIGTANADLGAAAMVTLGRAKEAPTTATAKGAAQVVQA
jgi:hypothetical protein